MDLFISTFESVAVLLGIGLIGFWIIKRKIVSQNALGFLSPLALDIALPSLIFVNIIEGFSPSVSSDWWLMPLWWLLFLLFSMVLTFVFRFVSQKETCREFALSLFYQNAIFFPLAILSGMFGDESQLLVYLFLFTLFYPAFFFNTYQLFFQRKIGVNWRRLFNPVLIATLVSLIVRLYRVDGYIPEFVVSIFRILGAMTLPLIMLIIGGNIYIDFQAKGKIYRQEIVKFVVIKNIVFPLIMLGILIVIRPAYSLGLLLLLQAAVPPVSAVSIFTERAGGNKSIVNQFIVASFVFSIISIPVMILVFSFFFSQ